MPSVSAMLCPPSRISCNARMLLLQLLIHVFLIRGTHTRAIRRAPGLMVLQATRIGCRAGRSVTPTEMHGADLRMPCTWREYHPHHDAQDRDVERFSALQGSIEDTVHPNRNKKQLTQIEKRMGSRPPLCSNKCNACSPCEAVQMPTPLVPSKNRRPEKRVTSAISESHAFFHLDYSNYQPEGWKCKCGNLVYNP